MDVQSAPEKIARSLIHCHFAAVCSRIARFLPKCSEKITIYEAMQNLDQFVRY